MSEKIQIELSPGLAKFLSLELEAYSERLSNDGCNDLGDEQIEALTDADRDAIGEWTEDDDFEPDDLDGSNYMVVDYIKSIVDAALSKAEATHEN